MPKGDKLGYMGGFQLWANLPASHKMMHPRYRDVTVSQIPQVSPAQGVAIKIICGEVGGTKGPVQDIVTEPEYLDISLVAATEFTHEVKSGHTVLAYVINGQGYFDEEARLLSNRELAWYSDGEKIAVHTANEPVRFLLISGKPIGEPVAWYGPIVMNTEEELQLAFEEYNNGTFIKHK
jgi:hypothetical protein